LNCPNCGTSNLDTASICVNCGKPLSGAPAHSYTPPPAPPSTHTPPRPPGGGSYGTPPAGEKIPNYLVPSIILLCCCFPLAIVAIIFAAQVNSKLAAGDIAGAREASSKAKMFCWIAFGLGIVCWGIWLATSGLAAIQAIREAQAAAGS
jgi:Interferon-induced transmembrane protein/zinc-ribbon domain